MLSQVGEVGREGDPLVLAESSWRDLEDPQITINFSTNLGLLSEQIESTLEVKWKESLCCQTGLGLRVCSDIP